MKNTISLALLTALAAPALAQTYFHGLSGDDFNNAANWSNGLPSNGGNDGFVTAPAELTAGFRLSTGISYHLNLNSTVNTGGFELQHRSGSNGRDVRIGNGGGQSGELIIASGGSLDIAGAGSDLFLGLDGGQGTLTVLDGGTMEVSKAIEVLNGSRMAFAATAGWAGNFQDELVIDDYSTLAFAIDGTTHLTLPGQSLAVEFGELSHLELEFAAPPTLGDTFDLITGVSGFSGVAGGSGTGVFGAVHATGLAAGQQVQVNYLTDTLQIEIVAANDPALLAPGVLVLSNDESATTYSLPITNGGTSATLNVSATASGTDAVDVSSITPPGPLAPGETGNLEFTFDPQVGPRIYTFFLDLSSEDPDSPSIPVRIEVQNPVATAPTALAGGIYAAPSGPQTVQIPVTNTGSFFDIEVTDVLLDGAPEFSLGTLPSPIAPGATGNVELSFDAGAGFGNFGTQLAIQTTSSTGSDLPVFVQVEVTPTDPGLAVEETVSLTDNGGGQQIVLPLANSGATEDLLISAVSATGSDAAGVSGITFPASIAAGASDEIVFDYTPSGPGTQTFDLEIASNDLLAPSPRTVSFTIEVQDPIIATDVSALDFGSLENSPGPITDFVTIYNDGGALDLTIDPVNTLITGDTAFSISTLPDPVVPGGSDLLELTFDPGTDSGFFNATLTIASDDFLGTSPQVTLSAYVAPAGESALIDFGTAASPLASGFARFVATEGGTLSTAGLSLALSSRDTDISASTGADPDPLLTDGAQTTFNGGGGNYISVAISGVLDGTLDLISLHDYGSIYDLPFNVLFGPVGGTLDTVATGAVRGDTVPWTAEVTAGTDYELRIVESGNANVAYISGLILSGSAVPGGPTAGTYAAFVTDAGLDPATTGAPGIDADGDGLDNGSEWVLGGSPNDPANPDTALLPSGETVSADPDGDSTPSEYLLFTYRRSDLALADASTTSTVEYGSTLDSWTDAGGGTDGIVILENDDAADTGVDLVEVYLPTTLALDGKLFARLTTTFSNP